MTIASTQETFPCIDRLQQEEEACGDGASEGVRTLDLRFTKPLLYH